MSHDVVEDKAASMRHGLPPSPIEDGHFGTSSESRVFNIDKEYHFKFRPGFGDIDVYPEVNNGRHLVFCDLARYDIAFQWLVRAFEKTSMRL